MKQYPTTHHIKVFDINSNKITIHTLNIDQVKHPTNGNIVWNVKLLYNKEEIVSENEYFLSESINKLRDALEPRGLKLLVKCADHDAAHRGLQAEMTAGTQIYKLMEVDAHGKFASYDVLAESDIHSVASLGEQKSQIAKFHKT